MDIRCESCGELTFCRACARCKGGFYCSRSCQKKHWPIHKLLCDPKKILGIPPKRGTLGQKSSMSWKEIANLPIDTIFALILIITDHKNNQEDKAAAGRILEDVVKPKTPVLASGDTEEAALGMIGAKWSDPTFVVYNTACRDVPIHRTKGSKEGKYVIFKNK